jgi:transcriptional regulator with XRE-family HTH domain
MDAADRIIADLEREREHRGLTYYAVAKAAGQSQIGVQRVLTGEERPGLDRILAIAATLGYTLALSPLAAKGGAGKKKSAKSDK